MRKFGFILICSLWVCLLVGCTSANSAENTKDTKTSEMEDDSYSEIEIQSDPESHSESEMQLAKVDDNKKEEQATQSEEGKNMGSTYSDYDFGRFSNVQITGIDLSALSEDELSAVYQAARYCQAMTDADTDTMREIVSEDMIFTHMSGMQQTREEYFADIEKGRLRYYTIGMENTKVSVDGDTAVVTYTSALNANAYGARGTFHMAGSHYFKRQDGEWIAVNRPEVK